MARWKAPGAKGLESMANQGTSGRAQGPGAGKPGGKAPVPRGPHRRGLANLDAEQTARLLIFGAVAAVIILAVGFLAFGYWYTVVKPRHRTVLQVENVTVSYTAMKRRMAYEFLRNTTYQTQNGAQILPQAALQASLNDLTELTQAESKLGVTLTAAEFDQQFRTRLAVAPAADQRTFADALRKELDKTGLTRTELERVVRADALATKIKDKFKAEVPATLLQAELDVIDVATQDAAQKAIDRINAGEDFAVVAKAVSREADVQTTGGRHAYGPKGSFNAAYDDYAFSGEIGKLSAPLSSGGTSPSFYVVRVVDRSDQPVTESQKPAIANAKLAEWLKTTEDELKANGKITIDWNQQSQVDALVSVVQDSSPKLVAQQQQQQRDQQKAQEVRQTTVAQLTASPRASTPAIAVTTPAPGTTPGQSASPAAQNATPVAPSQPVAPGSNGQ